MHQFYPSVTKLYPELNENQNFHIVHLDEIKKKNANTRSKLDNGKTIPNLQKMPSKIKCGSELYSAARKAHLRALEAIRCYEIWLAIRGFPFHRQSGIQMLLNYTSRVLVLRLQSSHRTRYCKMFST